jgi:hypothetical protein
MKKGGVSIADDDDGNQRRDSQRKTLQVGLPLWRFIIVVVDVPRMLDSAALSVPCCSNDLTFQPYLNNDGGLVLGDVSRPLFLNITLRTARSRLL